MIWQRIRIALLAGAIVAATGYVRADEDNDKSPAGGDKPAEKIGPPAEKPAPPAAKPATCTIWVNEWVCEPFECTRTVYKTECRQEKYTAYRVECVPETRTVCVEVPCVEERTVMKTRVVKKKVTVMERKCEDHGHYECREVPCGPSLCDRLKDLRKRFSRKKDCCDPCAETCCAEECRPVRTKTVKVWVPCPVWVEKPVCKTVCVTECYPEKVKVCTCKKEHRQVQVMVKKCVPYEAVRTVKVCVPCQEKVTGHRMVCRKVAKEVPVVSCAEACCPSDCCTPCCESKGGFFSRFRSCCK